jgi:hypothetical protein
MREAIGFANRPEYCAYNQDSARKRRVDALTPELAGMSQWNLSIYPVHPRWALDPQRRDPYHWIGEIDLDLYQVESLSL